jgi:hypothetical protein
MKRDMELIRKLLLRVQDHDELGGPEDYGIDMNLFVGHVALTVEDNFIEGVTFQDIPLAAGEPDFFVNDWLRLTSAGHDFIDTAQDQSVWNAAVEGTKKVGGRVAIAVFIELMKDAAMRKIGLKTDL